MGDDNLCETCTKMAYCLLMGVMPERGTCSEYEPVPLDDLLKGDALIRDIMVGACPRCGGENTCDCEAYPLAPEQDCTLGYCSNCQTYWCLECGHVFEIARKGMQCPHWALCAECMDENDYLGFDEFIEKVCPTCEHNGEGCELEDPSKCPKEQEFKCPYRYEIRACPEIKKMS